MVFYLEPSYWSRKCKGILITYQQLMYQHFLIVQQSFFPHWSFFLLPVACWHVIRKKNCMEIAATYSEIFYCCCLKLTLMALWWTHPLISNCIKDFIHLEQKFSPQLFEIALQVQISVPYNLSQVKWAIQIFFWACGAYHKKKSSNHFSGCLFGH